jgi:hypothetical protein
MSRNYLSGYAGHMSTTFEARSGHKALIRHLNRILTIWAHMPG